MTTSRGTAEAERRAREERKALIRRYIVLHLKITEVLHLTLLSFNLTDTRTYPENVLGHETDAFKETLLGVMATSFVAICDKPSSTDVLSIWRELHPTRARAISRVWNAKISPGVAQMKAYRDQAGAHADRLEKYLDGKLRLSLHKGVISEALDAFYGVSICLLKRQKRDAPELASEIERVLLDTELSWPHPGSFNRRWLRRMHLIESGPYTKTYR